mmetsp:Transcript_94450/g.219439  ORF Transcript_94450/g.219439 Transcript_94450/m.219439 type:complete len:264 (+) Transcript_94450:87-878(+)
MAMTTMAGGADPELVEKVKVLCRSDPTAKSQWCAWCDAHMGGTKDPGRMDSDSLHLFFSEFESGTITAPSPVVTSTGTKGSGKGFEQPDLAEAVKVGQRASSSWKTAWVSFCTVHGNGVFDPAKHTKEFLQSYMEFLGAQAAVALEPQNTGFMVTSPVSSATPVAPAASVAGTVGVQPGGLWYTPSTSPVTSPPAKRQCTGNGAAADPALTGLAEQVKQLQKTDPVRKQQWSEFCDQQAGGVKDPMRHTLETLQTFLQQCNAA